MMVNASGGSKNGIMANKQGGCRFLAGGGDRTGRGWDDGPLAARGLCKYTVKECNRLAKLCKRCRKVRKCRNPGTPKRRKPAPRDARTEPPNTPTPNAQKSIPNHFFRSFFWYFS
jgi:hypothetical protein